ncbi:MOB kinase activator 3B isoform X5 [Herpailurus yagouaroundi]|uniref:MOB kinase activator 3B isoform X5 n=1 Tax=Herpailurus yagouaroundi TaxID=1608482 RepID=UPI001AD67192|nr:MOB kinase activator 3B isoform X5 [Puma yagouaroundi]
MSIALKQVFNKDKTFRPKRKFEPGTQRFELHKRAQASLNSGVDLKAAVQLPSGEDQNDWVAVHVVDFFNRINLIYGTICEFCTEQTCPVMSGGPKYEYRWQDDLKYKKPTALPAPQYMNLLMDWIEVQINNEDIFPTCVERDDEQDVSLTPHLRFGRLRKALPSWSPAPAGGRPPLAKQAPASRSRQGGEEQ